MWIVDYDNDTGDNDDGFWEWWNVTNGVRIYKCYTSEDAQWLCDILNKVDK